MNPIYEQGRGKGIGHDLNSFLNKFDDICREHTEGKRAKALAFIFYRFEDQNLRRILKNQGVFAKLDRLSGTNLSIFYLDIGKRNTIDKFNAEFLARLGVTQKAVPPCVVFFRLAKDRIEDVAVAQLDNTDLINGFSELSDVIKRYIEANTNETAAGLHSLKWLKSGGALVAVEVFRAALTKALDMFSRR